MWHAGKILIHPTKMINMRNFIHAPAGFMVAMILLCSLLSCKQQQRQIETVVSVSIQPLKYFVDRLTGNSLEVNIMVSPGASHSTYSPTPQQFRRLSDSGFYIRIGYLGYEQAWIGRLSELNPGMEVLNLSDYTELIRGGEIDHGDHKHEGGIDPHIWMSPAVMKSLLPEISNLIIRTYPDLKEAVEQNCPELMAEIHDLDMVFQSLSKEMEHHSFMIYHPALAYLARDYGFTQISIEHEGKEPSPAMLQRIIRDAREHNIPVIFIQTEYDMRSAELISRETGAPLAQINPENYDYFEIMNEVIGHMREYMK